MEVRELKTKDFFTVATIISKVGGKAMEGVNDTMNNAQVGLQVLSKALEVAEQDVKSWFADLAGKTVEEFEQMGFNAPLDVLESLSEKSDIKAFFQRVQGLINKLSTKQ